VVYLLRWHGWCHIKLLPSWHVLCTPCNHAPCHFMQSHIHKVHAYLASTTCTFGRMTRAFYVLLWEHGVEWIYQNKSQHGRLTLEKKILPPLLQGLKPTAFQSQVRRSNHGAIPRFKDTQSSRTYITPGIGLHLLYHSPLSE